MHHLILDWSGSNIYQDVFMASSVAMQKTQNACNHAESEQSCRASLLAGLLRKTVTASILLLAPISLADAQGRFSLSASADASNIYMTSFGSVGGKGPVGQGELDLGVPGNCTASVWADYDLGDKAVNEVDYYLMAHGSIAAPDSGGEGAASGSAGLQCFSFPSRRLYDGTIYCAAAELVYDGKVRAQADLWHLLGGRPTVGRDFITLNVSKELRLCDVGEFRLCLVPSLKAAYGDGFLGFNGLLYLTPGASLRLSGKPAFELFSRFQRGLGRVRNAECVGLSAALAI